MLVRNLLDLFYTKAYSALHPILKRSDQWIAFCFKDNKQQMSQHTIIFDVTQPPKFRIKCPGLQNDVEFQFAIMAGTHTLSPFQKYNSDANHKAIAYSRFEKTWHNWISISLATGDKYFFTKLKMWSCKFLRTSRSIPHLKRLSAIIRTSRVMSHVMI